MAQTAQAVVASDAQHWTLETVTVRDIGEDELLVQIVAAGVCHTDLVDYTGIFPRVFGHEGAGYVNKVGSRVTVAQPGDPVLLSYESCGACRLCKIGKAPYCVEFAALNRYRKDHVFKRRNNTGIYGRWFGQSCFAGLSVVSEGSVVNVKGLVESEDELKLLAPMGCGIQTGCGTVTRVARATPDDWLTVIGLGGVGMASVMAGKIKNLDKIIAIDVVDSRVELAKTLGATHAFNGNNLPPGKTIIEAVMEATDGLGTSITIDTTGLTGVVGQALKLTQEGGKCLAIGSPNPIDAKLDLSLAELLFGGKQLISAIEGDGIPKEAVPEMIKWYKQGKLPIEKLVTFYPVSEFAKAIEDMHLGLVIKPVLLF